MTVLEFFRNLDLPPRPKTFTRVWQGVRIRGTQASRQKLSLTPLACSTICLTSGRSDRRVERPDTRMHGELAEAAPTFRDLPNLCRPRIGSWYKVFRAGFQSPVGPCFDVPGNLNVGACERRGIWLIPSKSSGQNFCPTGCQAEKPPDLRNSARGSKIRPTPISLRISKCQKTQGNQTE